ncbi:hypothetical protein TARUN_3951 [Trichoderma arundinaceum]|uniref:Uncharacterized protein n=1 Tax=Trichoderma arundinaceum TaxID=490622 RepID=A0A395NQR6_TRIAR|nr:hypothetical protein TARUN_3951 [Trichoderma arundinaceum]
MASNLPGRPESLARMRHLGAATCAKLMLMLMAAPLKTSARDSHLCSADRTERRRCRRYPCVRPYLPYPWIALPVPRIVLEAAFNIDRNHEGIPLIPVLVPSPDGSLVALPALGHENFASTSANAQHRP